MNQKMDISAKLVGRIRHATNNFGKVVTAEYVLVVRKYEAEGVCGTLFDQRDCLWIGAISHRLRDFQHAVGCFNTDPAIGLPVDDARYRRDGNPGFFSDLSQRHGKQTPWNGPSS